MKEIKILKVNVGAFKNLINKQFTFDKNTQMVVISGRNGLGKSNVLNAIYWCLTGVDLDNSSDTESFIPKTMRSNKGLVVGVEITTNIGIFERTIERTPKGLVESIYIDGVQTETLKQGEIEIDNKLGLLPFTLKNYSNKDFSMRRFALNPYYIYDLAPSTLRDVVVKMLIATKNDKFDDKILSYPLISDLVKKYSSSIGDLYKLSLYQQLQAMLTSCSSELKGLKSSFDHCEITLGVLAKVRNVDKMSIIKDVKALQEGISKRMMLVESDKKIIESALLEYDSHLEYLMSKSLPLLTIKLLKENQRGVQRSALEVSSNDIALKHRSTSEGIIDAINLMSEYFDSVGYKFTLPIVIDKAESVNDSKLKLLSQNHHQLLLTKVSESEEMEIEEY